MVLQAYTRLAGYRSVLFRARLFTFAANAVDDAWRRGRRTDRSGRIAKRDRPAPRRLARSA
jgi:hypothetical protein